MEGQIGLIKKAFELAQKGFAESCLILDEIDVQTHTGALAAIGPMAAEIYRQMTRLVIVTVKEPGATIGEVEQLRDMMAEAGWQGMVTVGSVEYKFPEDDSPVEVTIEGKES